MKTKVALCTAVFLVTFDQAIKYLILTAGLSYAFGGISVGIWYNSGGIFSINWPYYGIVAMSFVALLLLAYSWYRLFLASKTNSLIGKWGILLLFSGGVSNVLDRIYRGAVVDFLSIDVLNVHLNIADAYIILGGILVFIFLYSVSLSKTEIEY